MRCTFNSLVLATLAIGQAYAASLTHAHSHLHSHAARRHDHVEKRATALTDADATKLTSLGVMSLGINSFTANGQAWLGQDGPYQNEFVNESGEDLILLVWGVAGSWVNAVQPTITASIPAGESLWVSFADGASGAWTAVYPDTQLVNGQASNTWGEFTFGQWGVVDVSREVNMSGHPMSIVGPSCVSDMDTCVFQCSEGNTCMFNYLLLNCENGSQPGANYGTFEGAPSGGCGGMGSSATLKTTFS
ncbi:hypothetical protein G647_02465 [Cladophialophora carrionii CBS 160.54]|uniref:Effector 5 n=1 Tax=Cladophialophora carrionii CBS 160.54 TaxID=1279043 RepID=V9DG77_9EURO|nr:uncharacterized protein G647_02465 [Cladophialophora carrionii CBS 160.54]ETI25691.1 hypothetical protein G647_02465 [Cladophialophora carrionii CBS 160.54]